VAGLARSRLAPGLPVWVHDRQDHLVDGALERARQHRELGGMPAASSSAGDDRVVGAIPPARAQSGGATRALLDPPRPR